MKKKAIVIGAGLGGLAAASLLAKNGYKVDLFEKNATAGGKMQEIETDGYRFDTGPSLLTMPFILEQLFSECGENLDNYISLTELEPLCRYFYPDGIVFDNYSNQEKSLQQIEEFAPQDLENYKRFLNYSETLYHRTSEAFLFNPLYSFKDFSSLHFKDFLKIDAFSTVSDKVDSYFSSSYLRKFFKRFTTYNGSSPFKAPATLNVIPHVELNQGGFYVQDGLYRIAESLQQLAQNMKVTFHFNSEVKNIRTNRELITGIELIDGIVHETDLLFSNSDATYTYLNLLPEDSLSQRKRATQKTIEPSCSGFVMLLGCRRKWNQLKHHNIFFSDNYQKEFKDIFDHKRLPESPTIYIANTSYTDTSHAPEAGSNLFVLVNAPYLTEKQNWDELKQEYSSVLLNLLEEKGLDGLKESVEYKKLITPAEFQSRYYSNRGSIYGTSSNNRMAAFVRPRNKERTFKNLYLVGGSTHPGGGIPLVIQSAFNALKILKRDSTLS